MSQRVYVDTNVWIAWMAENDDASAAFFAKASDCAFNLLISDFVVQELIRQDCYSESLLKSFIAARKLRVLPVTEEINRLARKLPTHYGDGVHAATAIKAGVPIMTWNTRDFKITGLKVVTPNDAK